ncbi:LmeA family phospholipid-binding protein [Oscillatoria salina]|uniref:LmeA family phospholipid-binding protein n=1 Tax=Oscillatoria salina TaxID=331517 RepID=UPI001CCC5B53|nr:DUF2993 domain-containing protein [Oscillatoria salina]MBZ8180409.1 DUF2993 domain-containing protein [Oscillatoria salina IIICB1]
MEFLTIFLASLLSIFTPGGVIIDSNIENAFRSRFEAVEEFQIRIDNAPSYQIIQGKIERVRLASRGVQLTPDIRLDVLELETDPLDVDWRTLRTREGKFPQYFRKPIQAGVRLVLTEADLNRALKSPRIKARIEQAVNRALKNFPGTTAEGYELSNLEIEFLGSDRFRLQLRLRQAEEELKIDLESGLKVLAGKRLELIEPGVSLNDRSIPAVFVNGLANRAKENLDLSKILPPEITARILQLKLETDAIQLAAFLRVEAASSVTTNPIE